MIYTLANLRKSCGEGRAFRYLLFWGHTLPKDGSINESCLSQWWMSDFVSDSISYSCAEQYMMAEKARLFGDEKALAAIMNASKPQEMKALGRTVRNFDTAIWERHGYEAVKRGCRAKFAQNAELKRYLLSTGDLILVEASPYDRIWGIGIGRDHPDSGHPMRWKGTNLLGFALTEARDELLKEEGD
ncbi:NADAR family protein [Cohnella suwonensis]|uniref:NADAR family protein n=1 Tax=Cohnella suwonensis TaxID=696072 RepID=A0ABW0LSU3_9BACL